MTLKLIKKSVSSKIANINLNVSFSTIFISFFAGHKISHPSPSVSTSRFIITPSKLVVTQTNHILPADQLVLVFEGNGWFLCFGQLRVAAIRGLQSATFGVQLRAKCRKVKSDKQEQTVAGVLYEQEDGEMCVKSIFMWLHAKLKLTQLVL